jgi:hypothetical protein
MMTISIALFAHLVGMAALFVALAVEWMGVELLRSSIDASPPPFSLRLLGAVPRISGGAALVILVSGVELAAQFDAFHSGWVVVSFVAMVGMGALGGATLRPLLGRIKAGDRSTGDTVPSWQDAASQTFLRSSLRLRVGAALGIVYVMVAKPDLLESIASIGVALVLGAAAGVVGRRPARSAVSVQDGGERATRPAGGA